MMVINYELYKVILSRRHHIEFLSASKQLFISQSAVSQSIKTLERKLDQTAFYPKHKESPAHTGRRDSSCATLNRP